MNQFRRRMGYLQRNLIGLFLVLLYLIPLLYSENPSFLVHDYLDSSFVHYGAFFYREIFLLPNDQIVNYTMGGVPRGCLPPDFYLVSLLNVLVPPRIAFVVLTVLVHTCAYVCMKRLLDFLSQRIVSYDMLKNDLLLKQLVAASFAIIPFWPTACLSIAGIPIIVYWLMKSMDGRLSLWDWLGVVLVGISSRFLFSTLFIVPLMTVYVLFRMVIQGRVYMNAICLIAVIAAIGVGMEWRLLEMEFFSEFQSQRQGIVSGDLNLFGLIGMSISLFLKSQYHVPVTAWPILLILTGGVFWLSWRNLRWIVLGLGIVYGLMLINMLPQSSLFASYNLGYLSQVQLRFFVILPVFWSVLIYLGALGFSRVKSLNWIPAVALLLLIGFRFIGYYDADYRGARFVNNPFYANIFEDDRYQTLDEFYELSAFSSIIENVPKIRNSKVICVDILPQIAQFNGLSTIGGYEVYFPQERLEVFEEIRRADKKRFGRAPQSNWHNKCYFESFEQAIRNDSIQSLNYDIDLMIHEGVDYILTRQPLSKSARSYKEVYCFNSAKEGKNIYVYQVKCSNV